MDACHANAARWEHLRTRFSLRVARAVPGSYPQSRGTRVVCRRFDDHPGHQGDACCCRDGRMRPGGRLLQDRTATRWPRPSAGSVHREIVAYEWDRGSHSDGRGSSEKDAKTKHPPMPEGATGAVNVTWKVAQKAVEGETRLTCSGATAFASSSQVAFEARTCSVMRPSIAWQLAPTARRRQFQPQRAIALHLRASSDSLITRRPGCRRRTWTSYGTYRI